jgi:YD repeat-containing protein
MKRLFSALCAALLLTGCAAQTPEEPVETQPETKTVYIHKSMTRSQGNTIGRTDYIYDDENMLTDVIISNAAGEELERYLVSCDENGNPVEWTSATGTSILYTYDSQGRTLRTETYSDDTLLTSTEYTWSGALRVSVTVKTLTQEQRTEYTYDDGECRISRLTEYINTCNGDGLLEQAQVYVTERQTIRGETTEFPRKLEKTVLYTYDQASRLIQREERGADNGWSYTCRWEYDAHGNLLRYEEGDGDLIRTCEYAPLEQLQYS